MEVVRIPLSIRFLIVGHQNCLHETFQVISVGHINSLSLGPVG